MSSRRRPRVHVPPPEVEAMIEESIAQFERGDYVDWDDIREERNLRRQLTPDELAELEAVIEEADRGEGIPAAEKWRQLQAMHEEFARRRRERPS